MQSQKVTSYCNRFKILKPNPHIHLLRKSFQSQPPQNYQLAKTSDLTMRRYHRYCQNIQNLLPLAQWRLQSEQGIVHCFYIQLGKPNFINKSVQFEIYTEHIDLLIADTNKLITAQSLYILVKSLQAYAILLKKFQKVSVNCESFGLNMEGECISWINRQLDLMIPQEDCLSKENDVISSLIDIIREKSEFACKHILNNILDYSVKNNCKISDILAHIQNVMTVNKIKLASNLKYLVNRNKILIDLKAIQNTSSQHILIKSSKNVQAPLQFTKRNKSKENNFHNKEIAKFAKNHKQRNIRATTQMSEMETKQLHFSKPKSFLSRLSSKGSQTANSMMRKTFKNPYLLFQQKSQDKSSNSQITSRRNSLDTHNICIINKLSNLGSNLSITNKCLFSQRDVKTFNKLTTSQAPTTSSLLSTDKKLNHNSSLGRLSSKSKTVYKSFVSKLQPGLNKEVHQDQKQSCESSPEKNDKTSKDFVMKKQNSRELQMSFGVSSQKKNELILKGNNWVKTIQGLLGMQSKLNSSIVQGTQKNEYLADVKLQMLDQLNAQMTQSLMPSTQLTLTQIPHTNFP